MKMSNETRGMFLSLIDKVWGNLKTTQARAAWCKAQPARVRAEDEAFRAELIEAGYPAAIVRMAYAHGKSRAGAIEYLSNEHVVNFLKYHRLTEEVKAAFKAYKP